MNRISLNYDGKQLVDGSGNRYNMQEVLAGSLGTVHAMEIAVIVDAPNKAPAVAFRNKPTTAKEKAAGDAAAKAMQKAAAPVKGDIKPITKGSKVDQMFQMMLRKNGATFKEIQAKFGWSDGGTGSYVYYYPKDCGYTATKITRANGEVAYKLELPAGAKGITYR